MANAGDVLDMAPLGCRVQLIRTAAQTGGELLEFNVLGRPRGFLVQPHVHVGQIERYEVIARTLKIVENGREHLLGPGDTMEVPGGTAHRQLPGDKAQDGHVRVQVRPAGSTQAFLERVADLCAAGQFNRFGFPRKLVFAAEQDHQLLNRLRLVAGFRQRLGQMEAEVVVGRRVGNSFPQDLETSIQVTAFEQDLAQRVGDSAIAGL